ncbi:MAG TPA: GNAT family N-acetyltransferase [Candidatus Saccharimonadia bacterium]|nr:GNAT family N-acetyltransferase [Candidatus Saccharimonadia bacterium]
MSARVASVRDATRADIDTLVAYNAAMAWETEQKRLDPDVLARGIAAVFDDPGRGFYLVAELDGAPAGALLVTFEWSDWRCGDWWWIQSVFVPEAHRRAGVFRSLYGAVESRARARTDVVGLRLYVEWENERAQRTYTSLGMKQAHYHMYQRSFVALD